MQAAGLQLDTGSVWSVGLETSPALLCSCYNMQDHPQHPLEASTLCCYWDLWGRESTFNYQHHLFRRFLVRSKLGLIVRTCQHDGDGSQLADLEAAFSCSGILGFHTGEHQQGLPDHLLYPPKETGHRGVGSPIRPKKDYWGLLGRPCPYWEPAPLSLTHLGYRIPEPTARSSTAPTCKAPWQEPGSGWF